MSTVTTSTTSSTPPSMAFSSKLNQLRTEYESNEQVRLLRNEEAKIKATEYFLSDLLASPEASSLFEQNAIDAATYGKKLVQLTSWSGRGPVYSNTSLCDLLDTGDLGARMQDWLNEKYGEDEFRVFHYPIRNSRTTALTVSWDKAGFENADGIIRATRERAQQRREFRPRADDSADARDDGTYEKPQSFRPRPVENRGPRDARDTRDIRDVRDTRDDTRQSASVRNDGDARVFTARPQRAQRSDDTGRQGEASTYQHRSDEQSRGGHYSRGSHAGRGGRGGSNSYQQGQTDGDQRPRRRPNYDA